MVRTARPSDLYRLPEHSRAAEQQRAPQPEPPRRRFPAWLGVALVLAAVLAISGLLGTTTGAVPCDVPLVDIVSEDQAIAALALYGAQASTIQELRGRRDIYANPGPRDAARVAAGGASEVQRALDDARALQNPDPLVQTYVADREHTATLSSLIDAHATATTIALFTDTHDTIFDGTGSIPLEEAFRRVQAEVSGARRPTPLHQWGDALLDVMEERGGKRAAMVARRDSARLWVRTVQGLRPAAVQELVAYVNGLPAVTVQGLRGHPVAGPALRMLEQQSRQGPGQ